MNMDQSNSPLTKAEADTMKAEAVKGNFPTLETLKRYLIGFRTSFLADASKAEKSAKTRTKKAGPSTPDQIDFF
jgi:hypothetical protein